MKTDYHPIDCSIHDRLEHLAVRRTVCSIRYEESDEVREVEARIADIFAREGEEFLRTEDGVEVRLDRLRRVAPAAE